MLHSLKIREEFFSQVLCGEKTFEVRFNDRGFKSGDFVRLLEIDAAGEYTGCSLEFKIGFVTDFAQREGWVVFSLLPRYKP